MAPIVKRKGRGDVVASMGCKRVVEWKVYGLSKNIDVHAIVRESQGIEVILVSLPLKEDYSLRQKEKKNEKKLLLFYTN